MENNYIRLNNIFTILHNKTKMSYMNMYPSRGGFPWGINEYEFNTIYQTIVKHNLKSGFEFATGVAISTLGIGLGLKQTNGKLISIDSYIEACIQQSLDKYTKQGFNNDKSKSELNTNQKILEIFDVHKNVDLHIAWSPEGAIQLLDKVSYIDLVMLDGPKNTEDYVTTLEYLIPKLSKTYCIFVHDTHIRKFSGFGKKTEDMLGVKPYRIFQYKFTQQNPVRVRYPLGVVTNMDDISFCRGVNGNDEYKEQPE